APLPHPPPLARRSPRLKAKGKRGDVAMGHCMRKLLHLVFAVWKTNRPFDKHHFAWETSDSQVSLPAAVEAPPGPVAENKKAAGHKRDVPAQKVVTAASPSVKCTPRHVNAPSES